LGDYFIVIPLTRDKETRRGSKSRWHYSGDRWDRPASITLFIVLIRWAQWVSDLVHVHFGCQFIVQGVVIMSETTL